MSTLIYSGNGAVRVIMPDDRRTQPQWWCEKEYVCDVTMDGTNDYTNDWWPRSSHALGDQSVDYGPEKSMWYNQPEITNGQSSRVGFTGTARDKNNSPVAGATVRVFRTSDGLLIDTVVSGTDGTFTLTTPYSSATHFIVSYKASGGTNAADIEGVTATTLVGA